MHGKYHLVFGLLYSVPLIIGIYYFVDLSVYEIIGYIPMVLLMSALGSSIPDFDLLWGIKYHRNPFTHSCAFAVLYLYVGFVSSDIFAYLVCCALSVSLASHLFCDLVPSKPSPSVSENIKRFVRGMVPGNIRYLPSKYEFPYLVFNGICALMFASVLFLLSSELL